MSGNKNILEQLKQGDKAILNKIYKEYRGKFIGWSRKQFNLDEDASTEIYADAVATLYQNVHSGKLNEISTSIQAYLFAVAKNKIMERSRHNKRFGALEDNPGKEKAEEESTLEEENAFAANLDMVTSILDEMGKPCKPLLMYYYFEKKSMVEIAELMDYKNQATAKNQKYKCINRLRKLVFNN